MRGVAFALVLWSTPVLAAPPPLVPVSEDGWHVLKPEGFEHLYEPTDTSWTFSEGLFTTLRLQWFPIDARFGSHDVLEEYELESLDDFAASLDARAPFGRFRRGDKSARPDGPGHVQEMHYTLLGYTMTVGLYLHIDRGRGRVLTAMLFTSDERYEALGGLDFLLEVADGAWRDGDPLPPDPAWYAWTEVPPALAAPAEAP